MIVVYTALFGSYDNLAPVSSIPGVRFVLFTDGPGVEGWECLRPTITETTSRRENRKYKMRPQALFPSADWSVYHDANLRLTADPRDIVSKCRDGLNLYRHPWRSCAYAEAEVVAQQVSPGVLRSQLERYRLEGFPENFGLYCGGFLVRNHAANAINDLWWQEYQSGVCRDQVSLPYALWMSEDSPTHILPSEADVLFCDQQNGFCERRPHKQGKPTSES